MEKQKQQINILRLMFLTGLAFMVGGFFRTLLEEVFLNKAPGVETTGLEIFLVIWFGFSLEAVVGIGELSYLLRRFYPFRKLFLAGTGAFVLGILIPALLINQFFYALMVFPGLLIGFFFGLLLREGEGKGMLILFTTLGFLVCQGIIFSLNYDKTWVIWLYENTGHYGLIFLWHMAQDMIIGIFIALGVGLMLRRHKNEPLE